MNKYLELKKIIEEFLELKRNLRKIMNYKNLIAYRILHGETNI
ncbi:hypothetical protein JMUB3933_1562 [Leptotrichia wadei]|uniref:Uncharacterized protein n=1 Tax=Leptotrichia wadei TaxID=157687 RepID=A0A510K8T6_9FUSO|nr:hypothetical protein JMUB3933_1562 [Leptotrichia wadei]